MDCSILRSSVHEIFQARVLEWVFLTQGSNPDLPHCRQTLYHLSHQGSSRGNYTSRNAPLRAPVQGACAAMADKRLRGAWARAAEAVSRFWNPRYGPGRPSCGRNMAHWTDLAGPGANFRGLGQVFRPRRGRAGPRSCSPLTGAGGGGRRRESGASRGSSRSAVSHPWVFLAVCRRGQEGPQLSRSVVSDS